MEQNSKARRGRPREFDLARAIADVQAVFWKHGLEAVSLNQLADVTGLHKPSLYAAIGDKTALYLAALDAYLDLAGELMAAALSKPDLRASLAAFFAADLDLFLAEDGRGCFMLATAVPVAGQNPDIGARVAAALSGLRNSLGARIRKGAEAGETRAGIDAGALTELATAAHISLAVRARSGELRPVLEKAVRETIALICPE